MNAVQAVKWYLILIRAVVRMRQIKQLVLPYGHGEHQQLAKVRRIEHCKNAARAVAAVVKFWHGVVIQINRKK
jgi:hypothetical protein